MEIIRGFNFDSKNFEDTLRKMREKPVTLHTDDLPVLTRIHPDWNLQYLMKCGIRFDDPLTHGGWPIVAHLHHRPGDENVGGSEARVIARYGSTDR